MRSYDVAVIGAGVLGSWTAYWLAREGKSVALIDAYGAGNSRASSGGETRIIRMGYGPDEVYTRFSFRSLILWKRFFKDAGQPLFHQTGVLWMADANHPCIRESSEVLLKTGVPFEVLSGSEMRYRYPQIHLEEPVRGIFEPGSGALMARRAVQTVAAASRASYLLERVEPAISCGKLVVAKTASGGAIQAEKYVFACGPWLPKVLPNLLGSRIFPTRQEVFFFGVPPGDLRFSPPALPVWLDRVDARIPYGLPDIEGRGFKLAFDLHGPAFDPDSDDRYVSAEAVANARDYVVRRFPGLARAPLVESRVCQYENSSNGDFLIDRHPDLENVWVVGGGSGHGFKCGPAVGEYVANRLANRGDEESRFLLKSKDTVQQRQVF